MKRDRVTQEHAFDHNTEWQNKDIANNYDGRRFTSVGGKFYDHMEKRAIARCLDLAQTIMPVSTVLDLACGTGRISEFLAARGYRLTCGDISNEMLDVAKARLKAAGSGDVTFLNVDIYGVDQSIGHFDCVTAFRLFQHLTSDERSRALQAMAQASKRFVLMNVMYTSTYYGALTKVRRAFGRYTTRYTSTATEIEAELAQAGLRLVTSVLTQRGFNGNRVLLLEKKR